MLVGYASYSLSSCWLGSVCMYRAIDNQSENLVAHIQQIARETYMHQIGVNILRDASQCLDQIGSNVI